jgi:hypothetical protein
MPRRRGYNVYRANDAPVNWTKLPSTPLPGQYYRDQTRLLSVRFVVTSDAYVDAGEMGMKWVRIPDVPYCEVVKGRLTVATSPDDVIIQVTYPNDVITNYRPTMVPGADQAVWLPVGKSVPLGGAVSEFPFLDFDSVVSIAIIYRKLTNYVDIQTNMVRTFYTVVPVGDRGRSTGQARSAPSSSIPCRWTASITCRRRWSAGTSGSLSRPATSSPPVPAYVRRSLRM